MPIGFPAIAAGAGKRTEAFSRTPLLPAHEHENQCANGCAPSDAVQASWVGRAGESPVLGGKAFSPVVPGSLSVQSIVEVVVFDRPQRWKITFVFVGSHP